MSKDKKKRDRGEKDVEVLADRLREIASKSKSFVKYHDTENTSDLPGLLKSKDLLTEAAPVVLAMKTHSLDKKVAHKLAGELAKRHGKKWGLKPEVSDLWVTVMGRRLRTAVHDWQLAVKNKSSWALELIVKASGDNIDAGSESGSESKGSGEKEFVYGWGEELLLGWRGLPGGKPKDRELSLAIEDDGSLADDQPVALEFDDGCKHVLVDMKMGSIRQQTMSKLKQAALWDREHKVTHHRIWAAQRVDRVLLVSSYEQGKQILQIRAELFGNLPEPQPAPVAPDHATIVKAMEFMGPLLEAYCDDTLKDKHELKKAKDEKLKTMGLGGNRSRKAPQVPGQPPELVVTKKTPLASKAVAADTPTKQSKVADTPAKKSKSPAKAKDAHKCRVKKKKQPPAVAADSSKKVVAAKKDGADVPLKQMKRPAATANAQKVAESGTAATAEKSPAKRKPVREWAGHHLELCKARKVTAATDWSSSEG